jgi:hypothetical protein
MVISKEPRPRFRVLLIGEGWEVDGAIKQRNTEKMDNALEMCKKI